ncbi:unnamed protein product [Tenebrio molitor]|nr:unnamed protein product [Tenebrio molitor]
MATYCFFKDGIDLNGNVDKNVAKVSCIQACLMKNASTHNFFIYYPILMNKKIKDMVFQTLQNSCKIYFFGVICNS